MVPAVLCTQWYASTNVDNAVQVLERPLDKSIRSSDWEARPLSREQQTYAATDAHVLVMLCQALLHMH
jgi:ribonuclease D